MIKRSKINAIVCMLFWALFFVGSMSINKVVDKKIPIEIVVLYRLFFGFCGFLPFIIKNGRNIYKTTVIHLHLLRCLFTALTMACTYYTYRHLPLAIGTSIGLSGPLFISILAAIFLKERLTLKKIGVIVLGYVGVLLVVGPHFSNVDDFQPIAIAVLGNISIGFVVMLMKKITITDSVETTVFYNALLALLIVACYAAPSVYIPPLNDLKLLVGIGLCGITLQFFYTKAISFEDASFVAPLEYFRILVAIPVGLIFFHEAINIHQVIGTLIIIFSTYVLTREEK
jgi:drug/metabolite transporter (DMT)-like permease